MNITYIVGSFPKLSETFVLSQITGLIDMGHEVNIIAARPADEQLVHEDIEKYGLLEKTTYLKGSSLKPGFEISTELLNTLLFTDIIHAHFSAWPAEIAMALSRMTQIPYIFTAHAYDIFINPDVNKLREKFDEATRVITISDYNKEYLLDMLGRDLSEKIEVIRCGIDLNKFKYRERKQGDIVKILLVGRLVEKKGIPYAIRAFNEVLNKYQNVELRIVGDGDLKGDIVNLINELNLRDKVVLLGSQSQSSVLKDMEGADIFFLSSVTAENGDREGVPVSIMEAQATGLPVVSTLHTGIPEAVIDGKTGFLVPEKDTHAMAEKLKELIINPELRDKMGREGREYIQDNYDHKKEIGRLIKLFDDFCQDISLVSDMPQKQLEIIKQRVKNFGNQFDIINQEIKRKDKEIKRKDKEIKNQCAKINQLQTFADKVRNMIIYKIYVKTIKPISKWLQPF